MTRLLDVVERGLVPDVLVRAGIRRLLVERLRREGAGNREAQAEQLHGFIEGLRRAPVALSTDKANEQHYELPPQFFVQVLGRRLKYSSCYWPPGVRTLDKAEEAMLEMTCRRAQIVDGMDILELGCGWGSLSLWIAEHYPNSRLLAVSNSAPQRQYVQSACEMKGLRNLEVVTADMNHFAVERSFDRVVSVEMLEHMRNLEEVLCRIRGWLKPTGKLFVHIFCHRELAYLFETHDETDWMARHFFTGGMMPSEDLLLFCQHHVEIEDFWRVSGRHYERTLNAWLARQDAARADLLPIVEGVYGRPDGERWFQRWRVFFMACAELFGFRSGDEWHVCHYLFHRRP
jgi:cyclopropane-fatty-acyl-phospholipid synthase